jgi:hypothetical protein
VAGLFAANEQITRAEESRFQLLTGGRMGGDPIHLRPMPVMQ